MYRGRMGGDVPMWVELADRGNGQYTLTVLDGVPLVSNAAGLVQFAVSSNGKKGSSCALLSPPNITIQACPASSGAAKAFSGKMNIMGQKGSINFLPIDASMAYGYSTNGGASGVGSRGLAAIATSCAMPTLQRRDLLPGGATRQAISGLQNAFAAAQQSAPTAIANLDDVRRERLRQYNSLLYTQWEMDRLRGFDADASRMFDFRYQMRVAEQKRQYQAQIDNTPTRMQARTRIAQINTQLDAVYNPAYAQRGAIALQNLSSAGYLGEIDVALDMDLDAAPNMSVDNLIQIESGLREMGGCAQALGIPATNAANSIGAMTLKQRFLTAADTLMFNFENEAKSGLRSGALATRLAKYRASPGLMQALQALNQMDALANADSMVRTIAARETMARNAEIQAQQKEQVRLANAAAAAEKARLAAARTPAPATGQASKGGAPTARQMRDALVYEQSFGRVTVGDAAGLVQREVDYANGISRAITFGITYEVQFDVSNPNCTQLKSRQYSCKFQLKMAMMGLPYIGPGSHTFELRDGIWRSPTYLQALIDGANRSAASGSNTRNCTVQGFGTAEGASIRDQNGLAC